MDQVGSSKGKAWANGCKKAYSYLYIVSWDFRHFARAKLAHYVIPYMLLALAGLEVIGASVHFAPWLQFPDWLDRLVLQVPNSARISVAVLLFSSGVFMVWHHTRLRNGLKRHRAVLGMTRALCAEVLTYGEDQTDDDRGEQFVRNVLRALVITLERWTNRVGLLNATLVVRRSMDDPFVIFDQYPSQTFPDGVALDSRGSTAAMAALDPDTLVYIPSTRLIHGIRIAIRVDERDGGLYTQTEIVDNAYQSLDGLPNYPNQKLRALACVEVPNEITQYSRFNERTGFDSRSSIVLCLGCHRQGKLGELDFNTIQLAARLMATAFKQRY